MTNDNRFILLVHIFSHYIQIAEAVSLNPTYTYEQKREKADENIECVRCIVDYVIDSGLK